MRLTLALVLACGCSGGATPDLGYGNDLTVVGAQFRPGPFPAPTGGPATIDIMQSHTTVVIGQERETVNAIFDGTATGAILGIDGEPGCWIVTTQPPDIEQAGEATMAETIGLSLDAPQGTFTLNVAATDSAGNIGEPASVQYMAVASAPPAGDLVITLLWDSTADLDLHVVDALGNEAWSGKPSTYTPPPAGSGPIDPMTAEQEVLASGWLDTDANSNCTYDGAPAEHVVWTPRFDPDTNMTVQPDIPPGTYTVRVDTRSLCKDPIAYWYVEADYEGSDVAAARGVSPPDAALAPHGPGAGLTALTFDVP
ncbi:MAG TPA: hypothetical protein VGG74_17315 [Kofleriaceae bacterium]